VKTQRDISGIDPEFTRREFVVTTLAVGFALAVQPVSAQTITTDSNGLVAGEVKIPVSDGEIPAYRAMPDHGKAFPVVLVVQEIFGVHEHIKDLCRRFAKTGYFAIAPELYARQGDVSKLTNISEIINTVVSKVPDAQVMSDLDAAVKYAASTGKTDSKRLAITGFCWGGRVVWLYAAHNPNLKAGVAWYGRLAPPPPPPPGSESTSRQPSQSALTPKQPIDLVSQMKAPVLGLYGGKDTGIPQDSVEKMRAALKQAGSPSEIIVYPNAGHGFNADYRPGYDKEAATDGWRRLLDWFKKYGA